MSSSTVTYTSVYTDFEPWRFQWVSNDELEAPDAAPQSPEQAPPSLDYVPGPEYPPSLDYSLPDDASTTALSPGYVADSDLEEDPEEDLEEDPADGGDDDDDESSNDDDNDDDDDE
uniref:Uncharacterized protein n=1 Tax=Tanacetum cinerariifolium TaxID=118510 RepID=A0A6L2JKG4_TANCI|nr:hypothetical protein [Tanacetum cinerariifolium]